jgi:hypothetical protein
MCVFRILISFTCNIAETALDRLSVGPTRGALAAVSLLRLAANRASLISLNSNVKRREINARVFQWMLIFIAYGEWNLGLPNAAGFLSQQVSG